MGIVDAIVPKPVDPTAQFEWNKEVNQVTSLLCKAVE